MIQKFNKSHISSMVKIHTEALSGDFLPSLGSSFLNLLYSLIYKDKQTLGLVSVKNKRTVGFLIFTTESETFFKKIIKKNLFRR